MLKFNTLAGMRDRFFASLEQVFKDFPRTPRTLKTGLATLFLCCFFHYNLFSQCSVTTPSGTDINLNISANGSAVLNAAVFDTYVSSNCSAYQPANGGIIQIWQDNAATVPFNPTTYFCTDVGDVVLVYVTLDDPGTGPVIGPVLMVVYITDNVPPVVTWPAASITVPAANGSCSANITGLITTAIDNCPGSVSISYTKSFNGGTPTGPFNSNNANGSYQVGVTVVEFEVKYITGVLGNPSAFSTLTHTTTVTVNDNQAPTFTTALPQTPANKPANGSCQATHSWTNPSVSDNCGVTSYTLTVTYPNGVTTTVTNLNNNGTYNSGDPLPGTTFELGTTTFNYAVSDGVNPTVTHSFSVTVVDNAKPTFTGAPTSGTVAAASNCIAQFSLNRNSFVDDNCTDDMDLINTHSVALVSGGPAPTMPGTGLSFSNVPFPPGVYDITFSSEDEAGNVGTHTFRLTVTETMPPMAVCAMAPVEISLDSNGDVVVSGQDIDGGSTDNCGIDSLHIRRTMTTVWKDTLQFDCDDIATSPHPVELRVKDLAGNVATCSTTLNIVDDQAPTAQCKDISVELDLVDLGEGPTEAIVSATDIDDMSHDNCTPSGMLDLQISRDGMSYSVTAGTACADVGALQTFYLRVTDLEGNENVCISLVEVNDVTPPTAAAMGITRSLGANGMVVVNAMEINDAMGTTDNCPPVDSFRIAHNIVVNSIDQPGQFMASLTFDCDDVSTTNRVWLEVTDKDGNKDTSATFVIVDIQDNIVPVANCKDITVEFGPSGSLTVNASQMNNMSTDNCGIDHFLIDGSMSITFNCFTDINSSPITVDFQAVDDTGNPSAINSTCQIYLEDNLAPTVFCIPPSSPVNLGSSGELTLPAFSFVNLINTTDNCGGPACIDFMSIEISVDTNGDGIVDSPYNNEYTFDCVDLGTNVVRLRVSDCNGNTGTCQTSITIQDLEDPIISIPPDITIDCSVDTSVANIAALQMVMTTAVDNSDDCDAVAISWTNSVDLGLCNGEMVITRTWTATDGSNNTDSDVQIITVRDMHAPEFAAPSDVFMNECIDDEIAKQASVTKMSSSAVSLAAGANVNIPITFSEIGKVLDVNAGITGLASAKWQLTDPAGSIVENNNGTMAPSMFEKVFFGDEVNGTWNLKVYNTGASTGSFSWVVMVDYSMAPLANPSTGIANVTGDNCNTAKTPFYVDYQAEKGFVDHGMGVDFSHNMSNITEVNNLGDTVMFDAAPNDSITIIGTNHVACTASPTVADFETKYEISIPSGGGYVSFDWTYTSADNRNASFDPFGYDTGSGFEALTTMAGGANQSGKALIEVAGSSTFEFIQRSTDGACGAATTVITNFVFTDLSMPVPGSCAREFCYIRFWNVSDSCGNMAPMQAQVLTTFDTQHPVVNYPTSQTALAQGGVCSPFVDLDLSDHISDGCSSYNQLMITNNALADYGYGNGTDDASGFYPPGNYTIIFTVKDQCDSTTVHQIDLEVIDAQDPNPNCQDEVIVQLDNNGNGSLTPPAVTNGAVDNCPGVSLSLSQTNFTTADIGLNVVTLTATDASGNTNSCDVDVIVMGGVIFKAEDTAGAPSDMVLVPITVDSFIDVTTFEFKVIIVDGTVAEFSTPIELHNINPALLSAANGGNGFADPSINPATQEVFWAANGLANATTLLEPNDTLFYIKLNLVGTAGQSTPLLIVNDDVSVNGIPAPSLALAGTISILDPGMPFDLAGTFVEMPVCGTDQVNFVDVALTGSQNQTLNDQAGAYSFTVFGGANATITPERDGRFIENAFGLDVNTGDVTQILRYLNTPCSDPQPSTVCNSPYKLVAADVNGDNSVNILDVFLLNQIVLSCNPSNPADPDCFTSLNSSWRFIPTSEPNPFPIPSESISYTNVNADHLNGNFYGIKIGDVNCSANPTTMLAPNSGEDRGGELNFIVEDQPITTGENVEIVVKSGNFNEWTAYQGTFGFDTEKLELLSIEPMGLENLSLGNFNISHAAEGLIPMNWYNADPVTLADNESLFKVTFKALGSASSLSEAVWFNSDFLAALAFDVYGETAGVKILFEGLTDSEEQFTSRFALFQNSPNPFSHRTAIGFSLPERTEAKLTITDAAGKVLKVVEGTFSHGYHQVFIEKDQLSSSGVLFYRLETANHTAVRKMILLN